MCSMTVEEHTSRCCNTTGDGGCSGGRSSKKLKHNKVPQRGMGVAQLEKILNERQLKDAGVLTPNSVKFQRPEVPLPPRFLPNRHPLISNPLPQFLTQRSQLQQACSKSLVNVSLGATSSSSSVMNVQIEPPSNQSYRVNNRSSFHQDGDKVYAFDKMVGMKRSYPFSMENIPPGCFSPISRPDESSQCRRGNPSSLGTIKDQKTKKFIGKNVDLTKDFLTLAPPQSSPPSHSTIKEKLLSLSVGELTKPSYQGQTRDAYETQLSNQQTLHSFFPAAKTHGIGNGEVGEHVDLNLKL